MRAAPWPPALAAMPNPTGKRRRTTHPAGVIFSRGRTRSSVVLVRRAYTKAYPRRRSEVDLRVRPQTGFTESITAKGLFLASRSLAQAVEPDEAYRAGARWRARLRTLGRADRSAQRSACPAVMADGWAGEMGTGFRGS